VQRRHSTIGSAIRPFRADVFEGFARRRRYDTPGLRAGFSTSLCVCRPRGK